MTTQPSPTVHYPPISIGVVTHERADAFAKLLQAMTHAVKHYPSECELLVANNSGASAHNLIADIIQTSGIETLCSCRLLDSVENSISVGRNLVLDNVSHQHMAFIDDDEYPVEQWLTHLVDTMRENDCALVAGPIIPVFADDTPTWITSVDLHNASGLRTGDRMDYAATGNFLMNRQGVEKLRFKDAFGKSGGEDTEFFLRLKDHGLVLRWSEQAAVYEDVPPAKACARFMIRRFMTQGRNYRTILEGRGQIPSRVLFVTRATVQCAVALSIGAVLLLVKPAAAGNWLKRGFANLGKIVDPNHSLYG